MKIEKGINIENFGPYGCKWDFIARMEVGDSVLLTDVTAKELCQTWDARRARHEMIRAFKRFKMTGKSRKVDQFGNLRVWRVK